MAAVAPDRRHGTTAPLGAGRILGVAYVGLVYAFFYLPILVIILFAFNGREISALPLENLTTRWFVEALSDTELVHSLWLSTWIALLTAVLATTIGMPAAMVLAWRPF